MHLAEVQKTLRKSWRELQSLCGIPQGNLSRIARGKRGWDVATGAIMLERLGVDLNEQTRVYLEEHPDLADQVARAGDAKVSA